MKFAWLLGLVACVTAPRPVDRVDLGPRPAAGPWQQLRDALDGCAANEGLSGALHVRIDIDPDGGAGGVIADRGGAQLTSCVGQSLAHTRFPSERRGRAIELAFAIADR